MVKEIDLLKWNDEREKYEELYGEIQPTTVIAPVAPSTTPYSEQPISVTIAAPVKTGVVTTIQPTVIANLQATSTINSPVVVTGLPLTAIAPADVTISKISNIPTTVQAPVMTSLPVEPVLSAVEAGEKIMELKIYRSTKKESLDKLISQAKQNGIDLVFDKTEYNDKGQLVIVSGEMKNGDGKVNFNASDFVVVRLLLYKVDGHLSMKVIVSDKGETI